VANPKGEPSAPKPRPGSSAARLAAEVERLSAELAASRLRIGELENRIDVDPLTQTFNRHALLCATGRVQRHSHVRPQDGTAAKSIRKPLAEPPAASGSRQPASGDDVGRELIFDKGDAVPQLQLALLQALHLDDIRSRRSLQRSDRRVEIAMLLLQAQKLGPKLAFFLLRHRRLGRAAD